MGYLRVLEVQGAGDPGAGEMEAGHLTGSGRAAEEEGAEDLGADHSLGRSGAGLCRVLVRRLAEVDRFTTRERLAQAVFQRGQVQHLHPRDNTRR
ncbi:hypothetical protein GCM10010252_26640 [Streptomyces aureoverticillatus]|nr:hypothetical protein GCM10010252_26640 [Streptomyces aureoverticillatus]